MDKEIKSVFLILFVIKVLFGLCNGSVYKVGDSVGWSLIRNVNYDNWASSKTFQVGDTILFEYDPLYHNVQEVSRSDFHTCNATAPIATYATGNDSIVIRSPGHYYYICSFVGHCQTGQKVDIRVPSPSAVSPASGPFQSPQEMTEPTDSLNGLSPLGPSSNGGNALSHGNMAHVGLLLFLIRVLY